MHQRADGKGKMPSFCTRQVSTATKEKRVNPSAQTSASKIRFFFFISAMNFIKENRTHRNVHKTISAHTWVTHAHMECQNTACPQAPHALALPLPPSRAASLTSDPECSAGTIRPTTHAAAVRRTHRWLLSCCIKCTAASFRSCR